MDGDEKPCRACQRLLPLTTFGLSRKRGKQCRRTICQACRRAGRERVARHPLALPGLPLTTSDHIRRRWRADEVGACPAMRAMFGF